MSLVGTPAIPAAVPGDCPGGGAAGVDHGGGAHVVPGGPVPPGEAAGAGGVSAGGHARAGAPAGSSPSVGVRRTSRSAAGPAGYHARQ
jgi:hypothetical protein